MANAERGEVELMLNGKEYILLPTFNAMCTIERKTGKPLMAIATDMMNMSHTEVATIIHHFLKMADADKPSFNSIGMDVMAEGMTNMIRKMDPVFTAALGGSQKEEAKEEGGEGEPSPK